uniref:Chitin-binding type-2 domain-containing protein n=1 Tax=Strigamia maritima TaxID=126957 RepID=T1JFB8_STRMM
MPLGGADEVPDIDEKLDFVCPDQFGYYADKNNCSRYFVCVFGLAVHESCTGGLYFSTDLQTCDWPRNVMCNQGNGERANTSEPVTVTTSTISTVKIIDSRTTKTTPATTTALYSTSQSNTLSYWVSKSNTISGLSTKRPGTSTRSPKVIAVITRPPIVQLTHDPLQGKLDSTIQHNSEEDELSTLTEIYDVLRDKRPLAKCIDCQANLYRNIAKGTEPTHLQQDESSPHVDLQHNLPIGVNSNKSRAQNAHHNKVHDTDFTDDKDLIASHGSIEDDGGEVTSNEHMSIPEYVVSNEEVNEDSHYVDPTDYSVQIGDSDFTENPDQDSPEEMQSEEPASFTSKRPTLPIPIELPIADTPAKWCDPNICKLPTCFCGGNHVVPGGFKPEEIPQIVLITFDDAINDINWSLYETLFYKGRKNANGCSILATFYVSHEWTDYSKVQTLYSDGHEIASHSITHPTDAHSFAKEQWYEEIVGQKEILVKYAAIKPNDIRGMRAPFLQIGGNQQYAMMVESNMTYDSSMPVYENKPPYWPYTLDYSVGHECMISPCPNHAFPGIWEIPLVMWVDNNGGRCSMADACAHSPKAEGVYSMMVKNFERHYNTNRAPFGLFYHAGWFATPHNREGFEAFLNQLVTMDDVYIITTYQLIEWFRNPTPLSEIKNFEPWLCKKKDRGPPCKKPNVCNLWFKGGVRYMKTCQPCPTSYPWVKSVDLTKTNSTKQ